MYLSIGISPFLVLYILLISYGFAESRERKAAEGAYDAALEEFDAAREDLDAALQALIAEEAERVADARSALVAVEEQYGVAMRSPDRSLLDPAEAYGALFGDPVGYLNVLISDEAGSIYGARLIRIGDDNLIQIPEDENESESEWVEYSNK